MRYAPAGDPGTGWSAAQDTDVGFVPALALAPIGAEGLVAAWDGPSFEQPGTWVQVQRYSETLAPLYH